MSFLDRFFGPTYEKELKSVTPLINAINAKEEELAALPLEALQARLWTMCW